MILIANGLKPPISAHAEISGRAIGLKFGTSVHPHLYLSHDM